MKSFKRVFRNCAFRFFSSLTKSKMFPWCPVLNVSLLILFIWMQRRRGYAAFKLYYISFRLQASYHSVEILLTRLTRINVLLRHLKQQNNWLLLLEYMIWRRWTLLIVLRCSSFFFRFWFKTSKWNHFFPSQDRRLTAKHEKQYFTYSANSFQSLSSKGQKKYYRS